MGREWGISTAESIAWGLLSFIALIVWCRWRGTPEDEKESEASPDTEKRRTETNVASSSLSCFAADRWDKRSNKYEEELETLRVRAQQRPPQPRRRLRL